MDPDQRRVRQALAITGSALAYNAVNPFAQLSRFTAPGPKFRKVETADDIRFGSEEDRVASVLTRLAEERDNDRRRNKLEARAMKQKLKRKHHSFEKKHSSSKMVRRLPWDPETPQPGVSRNPNGPRGPPVVVPDDDDGDDGSNGMDIDQAGGTEAPAPTATKAASGGLKKGGNHETPISSYPSAQYLWPDTMTVVIPATYYISLIQNRTDGTSQDLRLLMNGLASPLVPMTIASAVASGTTPAGTNNTGTPPGQFPANIWGRPRVALYSEQTSGFYQWKLTSHPLQLMNAQNRVRFTTLDSQNMLPFALDDIWISNNNAGDIPLAIASQYQFPTTYSAVKKANQATFEKLYDEYTVLGTEWEIVCQNVSAQHGADGRPGLIAAVMTESSGDQGTAREIPQNLLLNDVEHWKGVDFKRIEPRYDNYEPSITVMKGHYKPNTFKKAVTNDEEIKTWHAVNTPQPTHKEYLHVKFWGDEFYQGETGVFRVNLKITTKQIIQFKDLKKNLYYPRALAAEDKITITYPDDYLWK